MAKKVYEAIAITGTYTDRDGNEKKRYQQCGVVFENERGLSLKLEALPVGEWNGWLMLKEPRHQGQQRQQRAPSNDDMDDDLPF